ncbi:MAG TPA: hypothetical protein VF459_02515, partial [Caulobacteraceae bacterium]
MNRFMTQAALIALCGSGLAACATPSYPVRGEAALGTPPAPSRQASTLPQYPARPRTAETGVSANVSDEAPAARAAPSG